MENVWCPAGVKKFAEIADLSTVFYAAVIVHPYNR